MKTLTEEQLKKALAIYTKEVAENNGEFIKFEEITDFDEAAQRQTDYIFELIEKHSL